MKCPKCGYIFEKEKAETVSDPMRRYYFGVVMQLISEETGHSKEVIHFDMKRRYASCVDDHGILVVESVFSNESTLTLDEKWSFIQNVRRWAFDFLDVPIPEPQGVHYFKSAA